MTTSERALLMKVARFIAAGIDTTYSDRMEIRRLIDEIRVEQVQKDPNLSTCEG